MNGRRPSLPRPRRVQNSAYRATPVFWLLTGDILLGEGALPRLWESALPVFPEVVQERSHLREVARTKTRGRADLVRERLEAKFGKPQPPSRKPPLDELIFSLLSQNTTDKNRDRAYEALKNQFHSWEKVMTAPAEELEKTISPAGLGPTKSRRIRKILFDVHRKEGFGKFEKICHMPRDKAFRRLVSLEGVGPKTASCVLLFSCRIPAFPVDTHIYRVCRRLGVIPPGVDREKAHPLLEGFFPPADFLEVHLNIIRHGRQICRPRRPLCSQCPLSDVCHYFLEMSGEKQ